MKDNYGRNISYLRLSVTDGCNYRCRYCMPEEGLCEKNYADLLTENEMISAVRAAASLGVKKLRITGGEPLLRKNILSICRQASAVEGIEEVCLTTNGSLLPELAKPLREAGVKRVNISLDTLNAEKFAYITRKGNLEEPLRGINSALEAGFDKVKVNAVLIGGFNKDEIERLANLTMQYPLDVRFIELMPIGENGFGKEAYLPNTYVLNKMPGLIPVDSDGGVAKLYRLPGAKGNIGLISPINANFCAKCNRIRLTADGKLKPCLHSCKEYSVKGMSENEMVEVFKRAISEKPLWHGTLSYSYPSNAGRGMSQIGG